MTFVENILVHINKQKLTSLSWASLLLQMKKSQEETPDLDAQLQLLK